MSTEQPLSERLARHISGMAPHQKDRHGGALLIEAADELAKVKSSLAQILGYQMEDYYPDCATDEYKSAMENAWQLTQN